MARAGVWGRMIGINDDQGPLFLCGEDLAILALGAIVAGLADVDAITISLTRLTPSRSRRITPPLPSSLPWPAIP